MKTYNYLEVQQNLSVILNRALNEEVAITRPDGVMFKLVYIKDTAAASPLNIDGITTDIGTQELLSIIHEQRERR